MAGRGLGARGPLTRQKITEQHRRGKALALRKAGQTFERIAETLICRACGHNPHDNLRVCPHPAGCECDRSDTGRMYATASSASRAVRRGLAEVVTVPGEELLQLELSRLDDLQSAAWVAAMKGNAEAHRNVLRTMERRAKYLGLDDFDRRMAQLIDAQSRASEAVVDQLQGLVGAVFARLDLPPDAQYLRPQIMAEELGRLGYANQETS